MAPEELENIFLSASVPLPERDPKYIETADIIAIRDAVISLVSVILPTHRLIWGGHPSITPLVNHVVEKRGYRIQNHVILYQSKHFERFYPEDNNKFENVIQTEDTGDRASSLLKMRLTMLKSCRFKAGVFIGGMEGVEQEFELFREFHPDAILFPLVSTGAASRMIYQKMNLVDKRLENDFAYSSLFKDYIIDKKK